MTAVTKEMFVPIKKRTDKAGPPEGVTQEIGSFVLAITADWGSLVRPRRFLGGRKSVAASASLPVQQP